MKNRLKGNSCKCTELEPKIAEEDIYTYKIFEIFRPAMMRNAMLRKELYQGPYTNYHYPEINGSITRTKEEDIKGTVIRPVDYDFASTTFQKGLIKYFPGLFKILYAKSNISDNNYINLKGSIIYNQDKKYWEITKGFVHSLPHILLDENHPHDFFPSQFTRFEEWECIIPKGTIYFQANTRGSHCEFSDSYASKCLVLNRLVNEKHSESDKFDIGKTYRFLTT